MSRNSLDRARRLWAALARVPVTFPGPGDVAVVVSPESWMCPPGWAGVVTLDGAALVTVPDTDLAEPLRDALLAGRMDLSLLPQWRARPEPSRRVARALGFRETGAQISLLVRR